MRRGFCVLGFFFSLVLFWFSVLTAGNPQSAHYSHDNSKVFWFVLIADVHIGGDGRPLIPPIPGAPRLPASCTDRLRWLVNDAYTSVRPRSIISLGDQVDNLFPSPWYGLADTGIYHYGQWTDYLTTITNASLGNLLGRTDGLPSYFDIPGNHDLYSYPLVNGPADYASYSVPLKPNWEQQSYLYSPPFGKYHFLVAVTPQSSYTSGPLCDCYEVCGCFNESLTVPQAPGELTKEELDFMTRELADKRSANLTFILGHHGISGWGSIIDGLPEFVSLLGSNGVSMYAYGHTHGAGNIPPYYLPAGVLVFNVESLCADGRFAIVAVDNDALSVKEVAISEVAAPEEWPIAIITAPNNKKPFGLPNPWAYTVPRSSDSPIRALVFDKPGYCSTDSVSAIIDGHSIKMKRVGNYGSPLYNLWENKEPWDTSKMAPGDYTIRVEAQCWPLIGSDEITVEVTEIKVGQGASGQAPFENCYNRNGGAASVGWPINTVHSWGDGTTQDFDGGSGGKGAIMLGSNTDTAYWVHGNIWQKYESLGGATGILGYPLTDESEGTQSSISGARDRYNNFVGGSIEHHATGPHAGLTVWLGHGIRNKWQSLGFGQSFLGLPVSDEGDATASPFGTTGKVAEFEGGHIYWHGNGSLKNQAYETHGDKDNSIDSLYASMGGTASWLGFPVSDEHPQYTGSTGYARSDFEGGYITTSNGIDYRAFTFGATVVSGSAWLTQNNSRGTATIDVNNTSGTPKGTVKYSYTKTRMNMVSTSITELTSSGDTVYIKGTCTVNGVSGYTFEVQFINGAVDQFGITIRKADGSTYYSAALQNIGGGDFVIVDTVAPQLITAMPVNGATNVAATQRTISFTFNKPMAGSYRVTWGDNVEPSKFTSVSWSPDKKTIFFTYGQNFPAGATITWILNDSFKDVAGNSLPITNGIFQVGYSPSSGYTFTIRDFSITWNGQLLFDDTFSDGNPPPSAPGLPTWYWTWGTMGPEKTHSPGGLTLDSSGAVGGMGDGGQQPLIRQEAELNWYLYNNSIFSVKGVFDLVQPNAYHQGYGILLSDGNPTHEADDVLYLGTCQDHSGNNSICYLRVNSATFNTTVDRVPLDPNHDQVAFMLTRGDVSSKTVTGSFAYIDNGVWRPVTTFGNTTTIFNSVNFTRAAFEADSSAESYLIKPTIAQNSLSGPAGTTFYQWGTGFTPNSTARLHFKKPDGTLYEPDPTNQPTDDWGAFWITYPSHTDKPAGVYSWWAEDASGKASNTIIYTITISPRIAQGLMSGPPGTTFVQWGTGFTPNGTATLHFRTPDGTETGTQRQSLDAAGTFNISYTAPVNKTLGNWTWWAVDDATGKKSNEVTYIID